jgi:serine/threonine-protein kinase
MSKVGEERRDADDRSRLARYDIVGYIARGGMADVFLARHQDASGWKRAVVIKRLLPQLAADPDFMKMFLDEVQIAVRLRHPNVVRVIEPLHVNGEWLLVLELVRGQSLAAVLRKARLQSRRMPSGLVASVGAQIALGLHHAHELCDPHGNRMEVVHRDVSPQNILLSYEGVAKIIDFGVARALGRVSHTAAGITKGTPAYMAPEQLARDAVDRRADLFSLGIVLWEALAGRRLYPAVADGPEGRGGRLAGMHAISPPSRFRIVPLELEGIVMKALEHDPAQRFQTAEDMHTALLEFADYKQVGPEQVGEFMRELFPKPVGNPTPRATVHGERRSDREATVSMRAPVARPGDVTTPILAPVALREPATDTEGTAVDASEPQVEAATEVSAATSWLPPAQPSALQRFWLGGLLVCAVIAAVVALSPPAGQWRPIQLVTSDAQASLPDPGPAALKEGAPSPPAPPAALAPLVTPLVSASDDGATPPPRSPAPRKKRHRPARRR